MKKLNIIFIFVFILSACSSSEVAPTVTSSPEPTRTALSTATETPLPTIVPTSTLPPVAVECNLDNNIKENICPFVESSVLLGRYSLIKYFGRDISGPIKFHFLNDPTKVSTDTSLANHKTAGLYVDNNQIIQINIASRVWADSVDRRITGIVHELTHVWQAQYHCDIADADPLMDFFSEGQAQYTGLVTSNHLEEINSGQAVVMWSHMKYSEKDWINSGDVAPLAFKYLVDNLSTIDYSQFCDLMTQGINARDSFQKTFGISIKDFRKEFRENTLGILKDCTQSTCGVKFGREDPRYGTLTPMIDYSLKEPNLIIKIVDEQGNPVPNIDLQLFRRLYNNFYLGTGGEDNGTNSQGILSAPVLPGLYGMTFCSPDWTVGHYSMHPIKCVYKLNYFEVLPGQTKMVEFKYWSIYDASLSDPNFIFTLLGVDGQPVGNQYVQVCGYDEISTVCLNGKTDDLGIFKTALEAGNYLVRLVQPGQGEMDPRGVSDPVKGMNLDQYHQTKEFEYEIRDIKVDNSGVVSLSYQFPTPNLKIQFLDVNGSAVPGIHFDLCRSQTDSSATPEEAAATDTMLSAYYSDWRTKKIKAGDLNGDCFLKNHTDEQGVFQIHVDPGQYFIYYDNPGSFVYEFYFDYLKADIVVTDKDVTTVSAEFK